MVVVVFFISFSQHRDSMRLTRAICGYEVDGRIQEEHGSKWQTTSRQQVQRTAGGPNPHSASASQQELVQQPEMQPPWVGLFTVRSKHSVSTPCRSENLNFAEFTSDRVGSCPCIGTEQQKFKFIYISHNESN